MKKLTVILIGLFLMTFAFTNVNAQTEFELTGNTAAANIIEEISLSNPTALDFGDIVANDQASEIKVESTSNNRSVVSGNATLLAQFTSAAAAIFDVTGQISSAYSIILPADDIVFLTGGGADMPVNGFETTGYSGLNGSGEDSFSVGATVTVGVDQIADEYTGTYDVTVAYN